MGCRHPSGGLKVFADRLSLIDVELPPRLIPIG
jgi:hypothetical protein